MTSLGRYRALLPYATAVAAILIAAACAPLLAPYDPYAQNLEQALLPPGEEHLLGTDRYGRDLLSRVLVGAQTTLGAALALLLCVSLFGSLVGAICGYRGGRLDTVLMRLADMLLAFPQLVFAIAVAGAFGGGLFYAAAAIAFLGWAKYARIARGLTLAMRALPYMAAARMAGSGSFSVLRHHVLPNIRGPILVTAALDLGTLIMELAGLSFLGLGAMPPTAEWGAMMSSGRSLLQTTPWLILAPGAALFLTVAVFNLFGDKLRDVLSPKKAAEEA